MDINTAPRGELIALIYQLTDKVELLNGEIARLRELLQQKGIDNGQTKNLPAFVKANVKKKKSEPRKNRDESYVRTKETPTERIFHSAAVCPDCGNDHLGKPTVTYTRQVIDVPVVSYTTTEHVVCKRWCSKCQKAVTPEVDLSQAAFGKKRIGVNLAAAIVTLRDRMRLPIGVVQKYLSIFHNLKLSRGEIVGLLHAAASIGKPKYQELLTTIRESPVVNADETGGRENGRNGYFWSLSTPQTHVLLYRQSRGSKVVEEITGENSEKFNGVLVTDFYASYNTYCGFHQRCWVHFLRDIHELKKKYFHHPPLNTWAKKIKAVYDEAVSYPGPKLDCPAGVATQERIGIQHQFEQKLKTICEPYLTKDSPMSTLCGRAINFLPEMFTFLRFPNVPSHNNSAERILRHLVVARKIQGGTRSARGSETKSILTSLFDTWQLQGKNPLAECRLLLSSC